MRRRHRAAENRFQVTVLGLEVQPGQTPVDSILQPGHGIVDPVGKIADGFLAVRHESLVASRDRGLPTRRWGHEAEDRNQRQPQPRRGRESISSWREKIVRFIGLVFRRRAEPWKETAVSRQRLDPVVSM